MSFQVGDKVGDYEIIAMLGAGGMGKVYKVRNTISDRVDAMKVLLPDLAGDPELADRFIREIKVLASLEHPNIAGLRTALRLENQLLMIMEFVEGTTLDERLKSGPLPVEEAIEYISQALAALAYAHSREVVHRDIKPANMMLTPEGVVKLMDFGIARTKTDRKLTTVGTTLGSLFYMSPEQVQAGELDGRSDLYSVGVSLYELVTGDRPFKGNSDYELMVAQLQQIPMPPIQVRPDLPESLNNAIMTAMEKDPARRFQSAQDFAAALASVHGEPGLTPTVVAPAPPAELTAAYGATGALNVPAPPQAVPPPEATSPLAVPPPVVQPPPPATAASKSYRGLYMTLGALIALSVIVLGATQIPRMLKTRAGGEQPASASAPAQASSNAQPAQTADSSQRAPMASFGGSANTGTTDQNSATPASAGTPASTQIPSAGAAPITAGTQTTTPAGSALTQSPATSASAASPTSQSMVSSAAAPMTSGSVTKKAPRASRVASKVAPASMVNSDSNSTPPATPPTAAPSGGQEVAPSAAPQNPASPSADQAKALEELRDRMTTQSSRAAAMKDSVENLRQRQVAQGFTLRPDISASLNRMEQYMGKADAAINSGDADGGKKYADLAEREIEKLEKFFGR